VLTLFLFFFAVVIFIFFDDTLNLEGGEGMTPSPLPGSSGRPPKAPQSIGQLERLLLAYVRQEGLSEKRTRDWISYMAIAGALERAGGGGVKAHFTLKGGVALELRLNGKARATRDLDFSYRGPTTDALIAAIMDALKQPYGRFTFERTGEPLDMTRVNTIRLDIKLLFNGSRWGTVSIDVNRGEGTQTDLEMVDAFDIEQTFGIGGPDKLPCLSLHDHMAQKIHGMTLPPVEENERVQDAIDVLLFRDHFDEASARSRLRQSCEAIFAVQNTHKWPPTFAPHETWREDFAAMANDLELTVRDLDAATEELNQFIIEVASEPAPAAPADDPDASADGPDLGEAAGG
jgi:hypothetical protein